MAHSLVYIKSTAPATHAILFYLPVLTHQAVWLQQPHLRILLQTISQLADVHLQVVAMLAAVIQQLLQQPAAQLVAPQGVHVAGPQLQTHAAHHLLVRLIAD
jgi:hypothetical protein